MSTAGDRLQDIARRSALALPVVSHGYPFTLGLEVYKGPAARGRGPAAPLDDAANPAATLADRAAVLAAAFRVQDFARLAEVLGTED